MYCPVGSKNVYFASMILVQNCILDSTRTCLEVSCSLAMCCLCYCVTGYSKVNTALSSMVPLLRHQIWRSLSPILRKREWLVCHSTIVNSPNPTSPLRNSVRQLHTSFAILSASNRQILLYKLLVCWTYQFEVYLSRKALLYLLLVNQILWFFLLNYIKMYFERKENKNTSWQKIFVCPVKTWSISSPSMSGCIPSEMIITGIYQPVELLRDVLLNISKRLLIVLHLS